MSSPNIESLKEQLLEAEVAQAQARSSAETINANLLEKVHRLQGQTQSILNARAAADLYILLASEADETTVKSAMTLVRDALKEARASHK